MYAALDDYGVPLGVECAWFPTATGKAPRRRRLWRIAAIALLAFGLWHAGQGLYIQAKAQLAQVLLQRAWSRTLAGETAVKPWPWADTWPVARLRAPSLDIDIFVLAGADGRALAFGPGHVHGTARPGMPGNSAIGGHRDTHLRFLKELRTGDDLTVERPDGKRVTYRVDNTRVTDKRDLSSLDPAGPTRLTLITCWPFDALRAGGSERYVVTAVKADTTGDSGGVENSR